MILYYKVKYKEKYDWLNVTIIYCFWLCFNFFLIKARVIKEYYSNNDKFEIIEIFWTNFEILNLKVLDYEYWRLKIMRLKI